MKSTGRKTIRMISCPLCGISIPRDERSPIHLRSDFDFIGRMITAHPAWVQANGGSPQAMEALREARRAN